MTEFVTHAFSAGVLAPAFYGRTDLDKYDLGLAEAENFYIDYTGGIKNRAGTQFVDELGTGAVRLHTFSTGEHDPDILLVFTNETLTLYAEGERLLVDGDPYTVATPYTSAMLPRLAFAQRGTELTIVVDEVSPRVLRPDPDTAGNFELITPTFAALIAPPSGITTAASGSGGSSVVTVVTSIDVEGKESRASRPYLTTGIVNYASTLGSLTIRWDPVPGAVSYRVYRSIIAATTNMTIAQEVGFLGEVSATTLVDGNILPDFARQPPQYFNPFANGAVLSVDVITAGSGYTDKNAATAVIAAGTGSDAIIYPVLEDGKIVGGILAAEGQAYTAPRDVTISGGGGTDGLLRIVATSPAEGNNPTAVTYFQQRQVFAASANLPNFIWGSNIGAFESFLTRPQPRADDAYFLGLDSSSVTGIKYLAPIRDGMLLFHGKGVDRLKGDNGRAITPLDNVIEPQAFFGVGEAPPLLINNDVIYTTKRGTALHALSYTFYTNSYTPQDLSTLASHLLGPGREPVRLAWQEEPDKLLWVVLADGSLLSLTYLREQEVFAWATHRTKGFVQDIVLVEEPERDRLYLSVTRQLGASYLNYLEVLEIRDSETVEFGWFVDCGLRSALTYPEATLSFTFDQNAEGQDTARVEYTEDGFAVGDVVRAFGGVFEVVEEDGAFFDLLVKEAPRPNVARPAAFREAAQGTWSFATPISVVAGLTHLNGQRVSVLADGDAFLDVLVSGGQITLTAPATLITVGIPYEAYARTLPLSELQTQTDGKKKRVVGTAVRLDQTRGMAFGSKRDKLYEMKDRGFEAWGQITTLRSDNSMIRHAARWERDASLHMLQVYPLPACVLGLVTDAEVGGL